MSYKVFLLNSFPEIIAVMFLLALWWFCLLMLKMDLSDYSELYACCRNQGMHQLLVAAIVDIKLGLCN